MGSDVPAPEPVREADSPKEELPKEELPKEESPKAEPPRRPQRRRITAIAFLVVGLLIAWFLSKQGPQEQHVRVVLGSQAAEVVGINLQYVDKNAGEAAREAQFSFPKGSAPRVVPHDFALPNGDYRLDIDVDVRDGRVRLQRQVTLGGGSTQIDISNAISRDENVPKP